MQLDNLPPFPKFVMSLAGNLFMIAGALLQILAFFISIVVGIGLGWRHPEGRDALILGGLLALQLFGAVTQQFGFAILRSRLPVRGERLARWSLCRCAWSWSSLLLVALTTAAVVLTVKKDWLAIPLATLAAAAGYGMRTFRHLEEEVIVPRSTNPDASDG